MVSDSSIPADPVEQLRSLYELRGPHHVGEDVSQLDHALQCASLARAAGASDPLVVAALLHDVGHLVLIDEAAGRRLTPDDELRHHREGARYLAQWFGPEVTLLVAAHVDAKRYLCGVDHTYRFSLSDPARRRLDALGGPMSRAERAAFEGLAHHGAAVALRRWDDAAKVVGLEVTPFGGYLDELRSALLTGPGGAAARFGAGPAG